MQIGLTTEEERAAYSNAVDSGLFDEATILKYMIETYSVEVVDLVDENEDSEEEEDEETEEEETEEENEEGV